MVHGCESDSGPRWAEDYGRGGYPVDTEAAGPSMSMPARPHRTRRASTEAAQKRAGDAAPKSKGGPNSSDGVGSDRPHGAPQGAPGADSTMSAGEGISLMKGDATKQSDCGYSSGFDFSAKRKGERGGQEGACVADHYIKLKRNKSEPSMFCSRGGGEDSKSVDGGAARLRAEVEEGTVWHATMPPFEACGTLGLTDSFRNNANNSSSSMLSSGGASGSKSGDGSAAPPGTVVSSSPSGPFAEWLAVRDRRLQANARRKLKFIPLDDDIDTMITTVDDLSMTIALMHKRELMYPMYCGLRRHEGLNAFCRSVVVAWMVEVNRDYYYSDITLHAAVRILDMFLCRIDKPICRSQLQLVGVTAVLIASKFYETVINLRPSDCSWVTAKTYTCDEVLLMERLMLSTLGYQVAFPLSLSFLFVYYQKLNEGAGREAAEDEEARGEPREPVVAFPGARNGEAAQNTKDDQRSASGISAAACRLADSLECDEDVDGCGDSGNHVQGEEFSVDLSPSSLSDIIHDESAILANYIIDNALLYSDSLRFSPSLQAATALSLSRCLPPSICLQVSTLEPEGNANHEGSSAEATAAGAARADVPAHVQLETWSYSMDSDVAEISGYDSESSLECAKFFLLSLASSKGFRSQWPSNGANVAHLEAVQRKYQQLHRASDTLKTRNGVYSRVGDGTDIAAIAQKLVVAKGWCDGFDPLSLK